MGSVRSKFLGDAGEARQPQGEREADVPLSEISAEDLRRFADVVEDYRRRIVALEEQMDAQRQQHQIELAALRARIETVTDLIRPTIGDTSATAAAAAAAESEESQESEASIPFSPSPRPPLHREYIHTANELY